MTSDAGEKMSKNTGAEKNDVLYEYLKTLGACYASGIFEPLFPLLSDDVVQESVWVVTPNTGREAVTRYFARKGETFRQHNCCPQFKIVQLGGNVHFLDTDKVHVNGEKAKPARIGLWYPDGKLCLLLWQTISGTTNSMIIDLTLDEEEKICRIDFCGPELYEFIPYERTDDNVLE